MIEPLQEFPVFEEFPALGRSLNVMIRRINAITPRGAGGHKVKITSAGTVHESAAAVQGTEGSGEIKAYKITGLSDDFVSCHEVSWSEAGVLTELTSPVQVAKPHFLRVSSLSSQAGYSAVSTNSRTYTLGNGTVVESLEPAYAIGNIIVAEKGSGTPVLSGGVALEWEDLNVDARTWQTPYQTIRVCLLIGGVASTRYMIVRGGAPFVQ